MWREDAICGAIASRTILALVYHDEQRECEPHILGLNAEGDMLLNGWQTSGRPGWRNFLLSKVTGVDLTDKHFWRARPDYRQDDARFAEVICQL